MGTQASKSERETAPKAEGRLFDLDLSGGRVFSVNPDGSCPAGLVKTGVAGSELNNGKKSFKGEIVMSFNKPVRRIAIDSTGVIGASWATDRQSSFRIRGGE